jgi:hypothetical protein
MSRANGELFVASARVVDSALSGRASCPALRGPHGMSPIPANSQYLFISRSSSRYVSEYWFCIEMKGVQPFYTARFSRQTPT